MPQRETAIVGKNNVRAKVTGQEELLVNVNAINSAAELDVNMHDGSGNPITSTTVGSDTGLDVNIVGGAGISISLDPADDRVGTYGYTDPTDPSTYTGIKVDASGVLAIQDNGGSITVDGTVALDAASLSALENVTVQNPGGASAVNIQDGGNSITVDGGTGLLRTTGILRPIGGPASNVNVVAPGGFYSVSVANVGSSNGSILGGVANIKPGEVLNFSADAINNYFNSFAYDATGTEFIIIYVA